MIWRLAKATKTRDDKNVASCRARMFASASVRKSRMPYLIVK